MTPPGGAGRPGRPKGRAGRPTVAIQIRVPQRTADLLRQIGEAREDCRYGGQPSPAKAVTWLAERWAEGQA